MEMKGRENIEHPLHPHALVLNDELEQSDEIKEACCSACLESLSFGPSFSCGECNKFHLHKKCAQAPLQITSSPFHPKHPFSPMTLESTAPSDWPYICDLCKEERKMFLYRCSSCILSFDFKCALLFHNIDESFREVKHFAHDQHPLSFFENPKDIEQLGRSASCFLCRKPLLVNSIYACLQCRFYLHEKCAKLPQFYHPAHCIHPLFFEYPESELLCNVCQTLEWGIFLRCSYCELDIRNRCAWPPLIIEDTAHHEHPFVRLITSFIFTCNACGNEGNFVSYVCHTCNIQVHQNCISLPRIIKATRHHHNIIHKYFLRKKGLDEKQECQLCFNEVKALFGNYCCSKQGCDFVAHVKCAMELKMYDVITDDEANDHDQDEESESRENVSSITRVIERDEHGEATKIEHFSHEEKEHYLATSNEIKEDEGKRCDGCMLFISSSSSSFYYSCSQSQCEFLLHKSCAELPRKKHLWFYRLLTNLDFLDIFVCAQCKRVCSGLLYKSSNVDRNFCMRCAGISHNLKCQGHDHSLFFDFKFKGRCNACGATCENGAFKCKENCTTFALDFGCITLPQKAKHKCDNHLLTLAFHEENDDPEQHRCDVCEEERDPNLWFYHCALCDNSAHPKCILGTFPFFKMKVGVKFPYYYHPHYHELYFVEKDIYDMICCSRCEEPLHEVALQCKDCNYIIHDYCFRRVNRSAALRVC